MEELTLEQIEDVVDAGDLINIAVEHGIPLDGCQSCEDFRERIVLHKMKLSGHHKQLLDYQRYQSLQEENRKKREALRTIFQTILDHRDGPLDLLSDILDTQKLHGNLTALEREECNVVIAGQTNAGKSTMLNLLLGMELLPSHILSCTSSICRIRYGTRFKVKVADEEKVIQNLEQMHSYLEEVVALKDMKQRELGTPTPEVEIFAPADILKSGVTIVDTPGFGELEAMDNLVKDFVTRGRIAAFVYVIKTDSAGGIQEDRLVRFLKTILDHRDNCDHSFNPRTALFVCSRWDQIDDSEKPEVKRNAFEKLRDVWPKLQDKQICFFSTFRAQTSLNVDREYITKELHHLLVALNSLFILAHQDAINKSYGWLKNIMKKCAAHLQTILSQSAMTDREHEETIQITYKQLQVLKTLAGDVVDQLKNKLQPLDDFLLKTCHEILSCKHFKRTLMHWEDESIPSVSDTLSPKNKKIILVEAVVNRISTQLEANERLAFVGSLCSDMKRTIEEKIASLETGMTDISSNLRRSSMVSTDSGYSDDEDTKVLVRVRFKQEARQLGFAELDDRMLASFREKPKHILEKLSKAILKRIKSNAKLHESFVARFTYRFHLEIDTLAHNIPVFIKEKNTLLNNILIYRLECRGLSDRNRVQKALEVLEPQRQLLQGFGDLYIQDMASDASSLNTDDPLIEATGRVNITQDLPAGVGLWVQVHKAELMVKREKLPVMVRRYTGQPEDQFIFKEIVKLRCLINPCTATFRGMSRIELLDAFVFDGSLRSAWSYVQHSHSLQSCLFLLTGVLDGLVAIHREELVHIELTLDTVMVNSSGKVKLCYMCLPRRCRLPSDTDVIDAADFTCLSPRVLRGSLYTRASDMYSYGLLVYELLTRRTPFYKQKLWKLSRFIAKVDPESMLNLDETLPQPVLEILHGCVSQEAASGIHAGRIKERLSEIHSFPEVPAPPARPADPVSEVEALRYLLSRDQASQC